MNPHIPGHLNAGHVPAEHPADYCSSCHRMTIRPSRHECSGGQK